MNYSELTPETANYISQAAREIGVSPSVLLAVIHFETGGSFSAAARSKVSSATGLIQFMDKTAKDLGTSTGALAKMSVQEQLKYVIKYYEKHRSNIKNVEDAYMAVLWPKAVGKSRNYVLFNRGSKEYKANAPLDWNRDGRITKAEAARKVVGLEKAYDKKLEYALLDKTQGSAN